MSCFVLPAACCTASVASTGSLLQHFHWQFQAFTLWDTFFGEMNVMQRCLKAVCKIRDVTCQISAYHFLEYKKLSMKRLLPTRVLIPSCSVHFLSQFDGPASLPPLPSLLCDDLTGFTCVKGFLRPLAHWILSLLASSSCPPSEQWVHHVASRELYLPAASPVCSI